MSITPSFFDRVQFPAQPQADSAAIVVSGQARFTVLTPRLLRLEWAENGQFEDHGTFAFPSRRPRTVPTFSQRIEDNLLTIDTGALQLQYRTGTNQPFSPESLSIIFQLNGDSVVWTPGTVNSGNLRGTRRTLDECVGDVALEEGLLSRSGWSVFDDSKSFLFTDDGWVSPRPEHQQQDWYFFGYGHDYKTALAEYTRFGGQIPLIPRFVLGAWWSRYWAYSDKDLMQIVDDFTEHDLPLDVLVLDMDWHTADSWTGYTWNRELFPDPNGFLKWVHEHGLRTTLNLHPAEGVQAFEEVYLEFARRLGADPEQKQPVPFQVTNKAYIQHYFELLHHPLEDNGVDFWWMDWQQGRISEIPGLDPLPWLNHLHFLDSTRRGSRAMLYSRWGGLGNHRYHIGFSGDSHSVWQALQFQPYFTATASNVAYGWWSHDIGGHVGATDPELFARWVQFGALSPCLRLHSTKDALSERRPWAFTKEVFRASRNAFHLRYGLEPYFYTMARVAMDTSVSLCRPMYYEYPEEEAAYAARYQYFLGDEMIAAPIVFPADPVTGLATQDVWIPEGTWFDFFTHESFTGPRWVRIVGDLDRIPLLVRAGAIIPMSPLAKTTDELPNDQLILHFFPGQSGYFQMYEDDGVSEDYHHGDYEWTDIKSQSDGRNSWRVEIDPVSGSCSELPRQRSYILYFEGSRAPVSVRINGHETTDWRYDPDTNTTLVTTSAFSKKQTINVELVTSGSVWAVGSGHNTDLQQIEVKRLLGAHLPTVGWDAMLDNLLTLDVPGKMEAVARLGGPLVQFIEYITPEEASQHLGCVIVGGPTDGDTCEVYLHWILEQPGEPLDMVQKFEVGKAGLVLYSPFGVQDADQPRRWAVEVEVDWHDQALSYSHISQFLSAAITQWQVVVYNEKDQPLELAQLQGPEGKLNPDLQWEDYRPHFSDIKSVGDPYYVRLRETYTPRIKAGEPLASYAVTTFDSPDERDAVIEFRSGGPIDFYLNGEKVEPVADSQSPVTHFLFQQTLKPHTSGLVKLKAGHNQLIVASKPPTPIPFWWFSVALASPDGLIMSDLHFKQA